MGVPGWEARVRPVAGPMGVCMKREVFVINIHQERHTAGPSRIPGSLANLPAYVAVQLTAYTQVCAMVSVWFVSSGIHIGD